MKRLEAIVNSGGRPLRPSAAERMRADAHAFDAIFAAHADMPLSCTQSNTPQIPLKPCVAPAHVSGVAE